MKNQEWNIEHHLQIITTNILAYIVYVMYVK